MSTGFAEQLRGGGLSLGDGEDRLLRGQILEYLGGRCVDAAGDQQQTVGGLLKAERRAVRDSPHDASDATEIPLAEQLALGIADRPGGDELEAGRQLRLPFEQELQRIEKHTGVSTSVKNWFLQVHPEHSGVDQRESLRVELRPLVRRALDRPHVEAVRDDVRRDAVAAPDV